MRPNTHLHFAVLVQFSLVAIKLTTAQGQLRLNASYYSSSFTNHSSFFQAVDQFIYKNVPLKYELVSLNLAHNEMTYIPDNLFDAYKGDNTKWTIDLSHNLFTTLNASWFSALSVDLELNMSFNFLTSLDEDMFLDLDQLQRLDLSYNLISYVHPRAFHDTGNLKNLDMSHNRLTMFEPWPFLLAEAYVDLTYNVISGFSNSVNYTVYREKIPRSINLAFNNLTSVSEADVSLYFNGRRPSDVEMAFKFVIAITNNPIICDCRVYWMLEMLNYWNLLIKNTDAKNYFTCGSPSSLQGRNLGYFLLHGEELVCMVDDGCPQGCRCVDTPQYRQLVITCDPSLHAYTFLPETLPFWSGKIALSLSGHALQSLDTDRFYLEALQVLDVRGNRLQQLPASFVTAMPNLKELDVRDNQLTTLPTNLQRLSLGKLKLRGNPLQCSCDLVWFGNWVQAAVANATSSQQDSKSAVGSGGNTGFPASNDSTVTRHPNATEAVADAVDLQCSTSDGSQLAIVDTEAWGVDCKSRVTMHALIGMGVVLALLLITTIVCWRWRYKIRLLLYYYWAKGTSPAGSLCCIAHTKTGATLDCEAIPYDNIESGKAFDVFVSMDEGDSQVVDLARFWMLNFLENQGRNPLRAYLPLRQELIGSSQSEARCQAIGKCRKVLVLLSKGYTDSGLCRFEFDYACRHVQQNNENDLVIVLLDSPEDVAVMEKLTSTLFTTGVEGSGNHQRNSGGSKSRHFKKCLETTSEACGNDAVDLSAIIEYDNYVYNHCENRLDQLNSVHNDRDITENDSLKNISTISFHDEDNDGRPGRRLRNRIHDETTTYDSDSEEIAVSGGSASLNDSGVVSVIRGDFVKFENGCSTRPLPRPALPTTGGDHTTPPPLEVQVIVNSIPPQPPTQTSSKEAATADLGSVTVTTSMTVANQHRPTAHRKKSKRRAGKKYAQQTKRLEELSQYHEHGQIVALEPLRSFLLEGSYIAASDRLFQQKLLFELSRQRKEKKRRKEEDDDIL